MEVRMLCGDVVPLGKLEVDEEKFVVCPYHFVRRYGWRSAGGRDHSLDGVDDWDLEQFQLYGVALPKRTFEPQQTVSDIRDNRDGKLVWAGANGYDGSYNYGQRDEIAWDNAADAAQARLARQNIENRMVV